MIATTPSSHHHQRHPLPPLPPSYSTLMQEEEGHLRSRFSVSTVGSSRPVSTYAAAHRDNYTSFPVPVASTPHSHRVSASSRQRRHQNSPSPRQSSNNTYVNSNSINNNRASISARDSFVHFSDSESDPSSPSSLAPSSPSVYSVPSCDSHKSTGSGSGSGSGHSCPPTPNQGTKLLRPMKGELIKVDVGDLTVKERRGSADSDVDGSGYLLRPSSITLGIGLPTPASRTPSLYLPTSSLPAQSVVPDSTLAYQSSFPVNPDAPSSSRASSLVIRTARSGARGRRCGSDDLSRLTVQDLREHDLTYLDDLDQVDNRHDEEQIIAQTLERNSLLMAKRVSVSSESLYSHGTVKSIPGATKADTEEEKDGEEHAGEDINTRRLSTLTCASAYTYATSRASVQTYGSSVLTYGSLASRPQSPVGEGAELRVDGDEAGENRPANPLPWNPRPSAVSRIVRQKKGPRPLPPLPANKGGAASDPAPANSNMATTKRRPRPLPRPPSQAPPLENIAEVPTPAASEESHQRDEQGQPTSPVLSSPVHDFPLSTRRGSRRRSVRYSALASAYGYPGRRGSISALMGAGDASAGVSRASSMSIRTGGVSVSGCEVPDIDELVRILDEVDFRRRGGGGGSSIGTRSGRARLGRNVDAWRKGRVDLDALVVVSSPTSPLSAGELDMGDALEDTRGCVAVPGGGIARNAPAVQNMGLPTPAATPKPRTPPKAVEPLPPPPAPAFLSLPIPPPPSVAAPRPGKPATAQSSLLSPPGSSLCPTPSSSVLYSPVSGVSMPGSHMSFPLPPEELGICGPQAVGAADVPIPVPARARDDDGEVTPSTGVRLSFAEKATLPGLALSFAKSIVHGRREAPSTPSTPPPPPVPEKRSTRGSPRKSTQDAIADLKSRVSGLSVPLAFSKPILTLPFPLHPKPVLHATRPRGASASEYVHGVPRLQQPVPPRRRATSSAVPVTSEPMPPPVPEKDTTGRVTARVNATRHPYAAKLGLAEIDVKAANSYGPGRIPPSAFRIPATGDGTGSFSAPAVAPLRFRNSRRGSELCPAGVIASAATLAPPAPTPGFGPLTGSSVIGLAPSSGRPSTADATTGYTTTSSATFLLPANTPSTAAPSSSASARPSTADAATTTFSIAPVSSGKYTKPQRSASLSASAPPLANLPPVAPLKFRNSARMRSASVTGAIGSGSGHVSVRADNPEAMPDNTDVLASSIPEESERSCGTTSASVPTETSSSDRRARLTQELVDNDIIGPELANIIHSIADDPDSQMASLLTIASSINSERHAFTFEADSSEKVDSCGGDEDEGEGSADSDGKKDRRSASSTLRSEKRRSKGRSVNSVRRRSSARRSSRDNLRSQRASVKNLAPVDPEALKALPDPNTFPIPLPALGTPAPALSGSAHTASAAGGDYSSFLRPSPLPKLQVITKFKGDTVLLPASQAPLSAASTKSTMSNMSTMSGISSLGRAVGLESRVRGPRKMNRLTLTDPRSPMTDAAAAAAALVERFRQKREDIARRGPQGGVQRRHHQRTGSKDGPGRARLPLTGSGFFGSSVRAFPDPVLRGTRPTSSRRTRVDRTSTEVEPSSAPLLE